MNTNTKQTVGIIAHRHVVLVTVPHVADHNAPANNVDDLVVGLVLFFICMKLGLVLVERLVLGDATLLHAELVGLLSELGCTSVDFCRS